MSYIKENLKLLIFTLVAVVIGGGSYYALSILPPQLETIEILRDENEIKKEELRVLEERLKELPQTKEELNNLLMETQALKNKIPPHQISVTMMMEIVKYMDAYDFHDTEVLMGEPVRHEKENSSYHTIPMTVKFTTSYNNATKLLEEISRSDHMVTVDRFSIDNSIQDEKNKEGKQSVSGDTVKAEILLSLHYGEGDREEAYPNFLEFSNDIDNVFLRPGNEEGNQKEKIENTSSQSSQRPKDHTRFEIYLADIFRSGDNYSFSAYSPDKAPVYVGLTSEKDTSLVLTVRDNGYSCLIEDSQGRESEEKVDVKVVNPSINITSQVQKVMENMPTVNIQIRNNTSNLIKVNMGGSLLENIFIYNENNTLVPPGKQVGKIALNI